MKKNNKKLNKIIMILSILIIITCMISLIVQAVIDNNNKIEKIDNGIFLQNRPLEGTFECEELLTRFSFIERFEPDKLPKLKFHGNEKTIDGNISYYVYYAKDHILTIKYNNEHYDFIYDQTYDCYIYKDYKFKRK